MAPDDLEHIVGVEPRGPDGGKCTRKHVCWWPFARHSCHFLAQRLKSMATLSVLSPCHGRQPCGHTHLCLRDTLTRLPIGPKQPETSTEMSGTGRRMHAKSRSGVTSSPEENLYLCSLQPSEAWLFLHGVALAHFLVQTWGGEGRGVFFKKWDSVCLTLEKQRMVPVRSSLPPFDNSPPVVHGVARLGGQERPPSWLLTTREHNSAGLAPRGGGGCEGSTIGFSACS